MGKIIKLEDLTDDERFQLLDGLAEHIDCGFKALRIPNLKRDQKNEICDEIIRTEESYKAIDWDHEFYLSSNQADYNFLRSHDF